LGASSRRAHFVGRVVFQRVGTLRFAHPLIAAA
jgi:hypothetical protein